MVRKTEFYRLLKPSEMARIESVIEKSDLWMSFKTAVFTGMRYKELQLFAEHPEWFNHNRKIVVIPKRRWAALACVEHPEDLSAGSTRKAWESWLIESGFSLSQILASQEA